MHPNPHQSAKAVSSFIDPDQSPPDTGVTSG
jgi:hypothetical protein